ncbi:GNAT family N-acetyltransferase [Catenulispora yoronensis]|uniref:GNAT family N-acetyltransferase n=1 Tax=Catenulispora yoronensis TaxID=450799 RepID=A0ABN2UBU2_9ACTN
MSVLSRVRGTGTRTLGAADLADVQGVLARDPVANVFVASRVEASGLDAWRMGGELWGYHVNGRLESVCYSGANLVPVEAGPDAVRAFAERARRQGRRCSSIVGPAQSAVALWDQLRPSWGPAREVRADQPLMVIRGSSPTVEPDFRVKPVTPDQIDLLLPACIAMFTEEVGVSPLGDDNGNSYRARVSELVHAGRAFAWIEDGHVVFKAEIGAVTSQACQIQGVWTHPALRGRGIAGVGMAAVVEYALRDFASVVSLYVNDYNAPARAVYRRVGFEEVGAFASILF